MLSRLGEFRFFPRGRLVFCLSFLAILLAAAALRLPRPAQRPLHTDEAVHAVKFGQLLENHLYRYDPFEYHGPLLVYSTLPSALISGRTSFADLDEGVLRRVPAFFGLFLVLAALTFRRWAPPVTILSAALLLAVSPAIAFYSRYYIMEIQLVLFSALMLFSLYRLAETGELRFAALLGASLGLMHAAKETFVLAVIAAAAALLFIIKTEKHERFVRPTLAVVATVLLVGAAVSAAFFTSFGRNPRGLLDSVLTYGTYLRRGSGLGTAHVHEWYAYFKWLLWNRMPGRPVWSEGFVLILGLVGMLSALFKKGAVRPFWRFIAVYTMLLTAFYSAIPYKTPWSLLSFYFGWILLAAHGVGFLLSKPRVRIVAAVAATLGIVHIGAQATAQCYVYDTDPSNPYVYAHTHRDVFRLVEAVEQLCRSSDAGNAEYIEVICPGDDYWPLPWYLRRYSRVGWFNDVDMTLPPARLIIAMPQVQEKLITKLFEVPPEGERRLYVPFFENGLFLRVGVEIDLFVRKDLWDEWSRQEP